jgi:ribulose-phosphate 3-epimerase
MSNKNSILITPSILNANFDDLESEIAKISQVSDLLHLDVMDNIFVPNFTFDFERAKEIIDFSKLSVDAHLMIADPDDMAPKYAQAGCASVTFHYEAAKDSRIIIKNIKSNGAKAGIAIKPGTKFSQIEEFIDGIDILLIMTVEPGFGGQSFMHDQMDKVAKARDRINQCKEPLPILQVDGGITLETIGEAASAGANCFVAGSAVYKSSNPADMVEQLRKIAVNSFKF